MCAPRSLRAVAELCLNFSTIGKGIDTLNKNNTIHILISLFFTTQLFLNEISLTAMRLTTLTLRNNTLS